jgi:UDP-2,3-diacylglucosamine pyrophosphatase LpxH
MAIKKRVFVSDIHMSTGWSLGSEKGRYDWCDADETNNFAQFLTNLNNDDSIQEVILLGDITDDWVYPIDVQPPQYSQIATAAHISPIIDNLRTLAQNKKIVYVQGNHDMTIMQDKFKAFRESTFPGITFQESYETADGIFAEHGHQYTMYNAKDLRNELPLGHYISRLAATVEARKQKRCRQSAVVKTLFPSSKPYVNARFTLNNPFVNLPLSYLANQLDDVSDATLILAIDDKRIALGEVREMYRNLSDDWAKRHGPLDVIHSVWREAEGFWGLVQQLAIEKNKKVIILGHTHSKENYYLGQSDAITGEIDDLFAIYANCGSWCEHNVSAKGKGNPYTYIVAEYDESTRKHTVRLKYWREDREDDVTEI